MCRISALVSGSCHAQIQSIPGRIFQLRSIKKKSAWERGYIVNNFRGVKIHINCLCAAKYQSSTILWLNNYR